MALTKIDFTSAYLQTGDARRDVYVVPPRECSDRTKYWLLLTAAYGLCNAGAKWQEHADALLRSVGLQQLKFVPQVFYSVNNGYIELIATKVVDDVLFAGERNRVDCIIAKIESMYKLGTIVRGPGSLLFFGLRLIQDENMTINVHADHKLEAVTCFPIDRTRRKQIDSPLNAIEMKSFRSVNSSIGWIGTNASLFCAFYSSYLQQKDPDPLVRDLVTQINTVRLLKKLGSVIQYKRPEDGREFKTSLLVFADASKLPEHGQLCYLAGLLFGRLEKGSTFHALSWASHKSKRPVKSIASAEILAVGEAIDEGKILAKAYEELIGVQTELWIILDSKDLYETLTTCRNATDRSVRGDVSLIRYEFETQNVSRMIWIPGSTNLADPGTKPNSSLSQALQLMLFTGEIPFSFDSIQVQESDQFTG